MPKFNAFDQPECREAVNIEYELAVTAFEEMRSRKKNLNEDLQAILDIFDRYDTSFVDNEAFLDWTTADWPETWAAKNDPNAQEPELNWSM